MIKSFFLDKKWALWAWGGFLFIIGSLLAQTWIDVKINQWYKSFYDLLQKAAESDVSEFYDGLFLFMKLAIPYVIIYTITNYFTRLYAFRWREAMTFAYMPYWKKVDSKVEGTITNITDFALFVNIKDFNFNAMIHYKDISYEELEEELKKFKKNDPITAKVLECNQEKEKIRLGLKQLLPDPLDYFKDKKKKDIITVIILETLDNSIKVTPDGCPIKIIIKKNQIAIDKEDQRTSRFNKGDKIDCMLIDLDLKKRKVSLSIKMLEEEQTKEAIKRYGSVDSGRSLPFAELPKTLKKKAKKEEK